MSRCSAALQQRRRIAAVTCCSETFEEAHDVLRHRGVVGCNERHQRQHLHHKPMCRLIVQVHCTATLPTLPSMCYEFNTGSLVATKETGASSWVLRATEREYLHCRHPHCSRLAGAHGLHQCRLRIRQQPAGWKEETPSIISQSAMPGTVRNTAHKAYDAVLLCPGVRLLASSVIHGNCMALAASCRASRSAGAGKSQRVEHNKALLSGLLVGAEGDDLKPEECQC